MTASNNITLNVGNQGLSFAIDKELDKQLGKDVTLNYNQWTSVFNIIKANQVETNKSQFGENDTNINDGKQFVVQQNEQYQIKTDVWSQIIDIAKQSLGIQTKAAEASKTTEADAAPEEKESKSENDTKTTVTNLLAEAGIELDETNLNKVVQKYNTILEYNQNNNIQTDTESISQRMINYAKGLQYETVEQQFAAAEQNLNVENPENYTQEELTQEYTRQRQNIDIKYENQDIKKAMASGDMNKYMQATRDFASQYIELYDDAAGDGKISYEEYTAKEAQGNEDVYNSEIAKKVFDFLDKDKSGKLENHEVAAYLWAMSKINDGADGRTAHDITYQENLTTAAALSYIAMGSTDEAERKIKENFEQAYQIGYDNFKP